MFGSKEFIAKAKELVADYANKHLDKSDNKEITTNDVYIVWFAYTLGNQKALASTTLFDGMYYEITFDRDMCAIYFDAYKKFENQKIEIPESVVYGAPKEE